MGGGASKVAGDAPMAKRTAAELLATKPEDLLSVEPGAHRTPTKTTPAKKVSLFGTPAEGDVAQRLESLSESVRGKAPAAATPTRKFVLPHERPGEPPPPLEGPLELLSVGELRAFIMEGGMRHDDCFERPELVERARHLGSLELLKTASLRKLLEVTGRKHDDCLERSELIERLQAAIAAGGRKSVPQEAASSAAADGPSDDPFSTPPQKRTVTRLSKEAAGTDGKTSLASDAAMEAMIREREADRAAYEAEQRQAAAAASAALAAAEREVQRLQREDKVQARVLDLEARLAVEQERREMEAAERAALQKELALAREAAKEEANQRGAQAVEMELELVRAQEQVARLQAELKAAEQRKQQAAAAPSGAVLTLPNGQQAAVVPTGNGGFARETSPTFGRPKGMKLPFPSLHISASPGADTMSEGGCSNGFGSTMPPLTPEEEALYRDLDMLRPGSPERECQPEGGAPATIAPAPLPPSKKAAEEGVLLASILPADDEPKERGEAEINEELTAARLDHACADGAAERVELAHKISSLEAELAVASAR